MWQNSQFTVDPVTGVQQLLVNLWIQSVFQKSTNRKCWKVVAFFAVPWKLFYFRKKFWRSRSEVFCKKGALRNFATWNLKPATSIKMQHWHRFFPVNFTKFLETPFYRTPPVAAPENYRPENFLLWRVYPNNS